MIKSNNYILNAMTAMDSKAKGGYQGIPIDEEGYIYESAMANLAIVSEGRFITPPDENILIGTTLSLVLK
jgi:branched-subunit amino acid aminotransferase/4-amino-4-deoxychorismate lyase